MRFGKTAKVKHRILITVPIFYVEKKKLMKNFKKSAINKYSSKNISIILSTISFVLLIYLCFVFYFY